MDTTSVPDEFDCLFLTIEIAEGEIRYGERVAHCQFSIGNIIFFLLGEFGLIEVCVNELIKEMVDIFSLGFLFGVKPTQQEVHLSHIVHDLLIFAVKLHLRMELCEDILTHLYDVLGLNEKVIFQAADYQQEDVLSY